jgi:hypothetical protein
VSAGSLLAAAAGIERGGRAVTTIRERDAELTDVESPEEWISHATWQAHADRRALLAAGDRLAAAAQVYLVHLNVEQGPDNSEQMLAWAETDYRLVEALRPALSAWKAATG